MIRFVMSVIALLQFMFTEVYSSSPLGRFMELAQDEDSSSDRLQQIKKWHCTNEPSINSGDFNNVVKAKNFQGKDRFASLNVLIPDLEEPVTIYKVLTSGMNNSCGFRSLSASRDLVYLEKARIGVVCNALLSNPNLRKQAETALLNGDFKTFFALFNACEFVLSKSNALLPADPCRKVVVWTLVKAICANNKTVIDLISPQFLLYLTHVTEPKSNILEEKARQAIFKDYRSIIEQNIAQAPEESPWREVNAVPSPETKEGENPKILPAEEKLEKYRSNLENDKIKAYSEIKDAIFGSISTDKALGFVDTKKVVDDLCKGMDLEEGVFKVNELIGFINDRFGQTLKKNDVSEVRGHEQIVSKIRAIATDNAVNAITSLNDEKIWQSFVMHRVTPEELKAIIETNNELQTFFGYQLARIAEIDRKFSFVSDKMYAADGCIDERMQLLMVRYIGQYLGTTGVQLEIDTAYPDAQNGVLAAIAYLQNASLVVVAEHPMQFANGKIVPAGGIIQRYVKEDGDKVIYVLFSGGGFGGHYSRAITKEQYEQALAIYAPKK